jgi:DNA repair exonuclease SbcCD nuclease subunit
MKPFKVAHISDLHFSINYPDIFAYKDEKDTSLNQPVYIVKHLHKFFNTIKMKNVDFIAVTGDLLDAAGDSQSATENYIKAHPVWADIIEDQYIKLRLLLDKTGIPYLTVPGNHDFIRIMLRVFNRSEYSSNGLYITVFRDYENQDHVPERKNITDWEGLLKDKVKPVQVHLQHYIIYPELKLEYPYNYSDCIRMKEKMVNAAGRILSLSGHYHPGTEVEKINNCWFSAVPAFYKPPHFFRIYTLTDNLIETEEFTTV